MGIRLLSDSTFERYSAGAVEIALHDNSFVFVGGRSSILHFT